MSIPGRAYGRVEDDFVCPPRQGESIWLNPAGRAWFMADPRRYRRRAVWGHAAWSRTVWARSVSRRYVLQPTAKSRFRTKVLALISIVAIALIALAAFAVLAWR